MSTLSGIAAKGEKGKARYQLLDINSLFHANRGESSEPHQHKNISSRRHGMQSLGKVLTSARRRAPANLPSLKSEYSGNDPAISLVPSGGSGWGSKPGETGPPPSTQASTSSTQSATAVTSTPATTVAAPTTSTAPATVSAPAQAPITTSTSVTPATASGGDKSWSSITSSGTESSPMFLGHQSIYFQQEFPSLSGDASASSGAGPNKTDTTHLPGPSLRPQTEGSWMQGGSRPQGPMGAGHGSQPGTAPAQAPLPHPHLPQGLDVGGGRSNLGPSGVGVGPAGPTPPAAVAPHYRLMPQFMMKHNHPSGGFPPNLQHGPSSRSRFPNPPDARFTQPNRGPSNQDQEEVSSRPIIKEEDLKVMDEISRDTGWAAHDEIDYNQTLAFSDEEGAQDDESKPKNYRQSLQIVDKRDTDNKTSEKEKPLDYEDRTNRKNSRESMFPPNEGPGNQRAGWQQRPQDFRQAAPPVMMGFQPQQPRLQNHSVSEPPHVRQGEDEEAVQERRRMINKREIALATEKAKQRRVEEEKRFIETREAAARKLKILEEKMEKREGIKEEITGSSTIMLPDWEKEKSRSRTNSEEKDDKPHKETGDNFRNVQIDNRGGFGRDRERDRDRESRPEREGGGQPFSRQFQSNLPPRFQKQVAERPSPYYRQSSGGSPQPPSSGQPSYDKWPMGQPASSFGGPASNVKSFKNHDSDIPERDRDDAKENIRDRDRAMDGAFENLENRYNRPPSRDKQERSTEHNWKSSNYLEETSHHRNNSESEIGQEFDNRQYEKCEDADEHKMDKDYRFYEDSRDMKNKSNDSLKSHASQEAPFDERNFVREIKSENERREITQKIELRDRPDRPQRPDSRDSRASRDSRNSKESIREENRLLEENFHEASWADSTFDIDHKDDKRRKDIREEREPRRDMHTMQTHIQRHIPGPITKEKLEASELRCDSTRNTNLVPLVRAEKKTEIKKPENQWETGSSGDAWQRMPTIPAPPSTASSESWADMTGSTSSANLKTELSPDEGQGEPIESQQPKVDADESNKSITKSSSQDKESMESSLKSEFQRDKVGTGRGGNRGMRHDSRSSRQQNWGPGFYRGGPPSWRGERGRRPMGGNRRPPHGGRGGEWGGHSESEASADEVSASTESGKEDKRLDQERKHAPRSPKQGMRKPDKDDRRDNNRRIDMGNDGYPSGNDNRRYEKRAMYEGNQVGIGPQPRGEPSRRGRGSAPFRSKGTAANMSRMIDGYGLPTSKRPFTSDSSSNVHEDKKSDGSTQNQTGKDEMSLDDKMKMNQLQLSAGIIGNTARPGNFKSQSSTFPPRLRRKSEGERRERKSRDTSKRLPRGSIKSGSGSGGEDGAWETTSETSEHEERGPEGEDDRSNDQKRNYQGSNRSGHVRRHSQSNRNAGREKRRGSYDREVGDQTRRSASSAGSQAMVNGNMRNNKTIGSNREQQESRNVDQLGDKKHPRNDNKEKRNNLDRIDLCNTASVVVIDDQPEGSVEEDQTVFATDNNGFQEVRSKKNVKDTNRLKEEPPRGSKERGKANKPPSSQSPGPSANSSAPPNKGAHDRQRPGKLPPRLAKQKEMIRMHKMGQQPYDVTELNKINQGMSMFPVKDLTSPAPPPPVNAWDKPITALRTSTPPTAPPSSGPIQEACKTEPNDHVNSATSSQRSSPNEDKSVTKISRELSEKAVLDGTSPPVQTIIFENTNYKSTPVDVAMKSKYASQINKNQKLEKGRERKLEEDNVSLGFKSPGPEMKLQETKSDPIQMPISFNKNEDNADMKLDFRFDSELTQLTEDKSNKSMTAMQMTRTIQQMSAQSSAADLQIKLASVKKVWENSPVVMEHGGEESNNPPTATSFAPSFGTTVEDTTTYGKPGVDPVVDDGSSMPPEAVYSSGQQLQNNPNSYNGSTVQNMMKTDPSSNVCKVKPQPQATMHHSHHAGPLSPPTGAFNSSPAQPSQHISYQPPYGGIPAIPSPPAVFTPQAELYQTFQINSQQVLGSQGRSQFSNFAPYQLSQNLSQSTAFSQQSMYLHQTAPPPPPPSAAPPDIFQTQLPHSYRIQQQPYGNTQQLGNNPNTVLISSSANSLMSASVKPSPQPIGAIGTKGASYQTQSQPPSQLYIYPDPSLLSQSQFLQNSTLVQRPAIPPSSASYYSPSTGGGATGYYQPGNSSMQAAAHQTTFNMQYNTQSPAATPPGMGSFGSTFLSNGLQMAQQYRSTAPSYLKSAADHQDVLSVFSSPATQINSPKSRTAGNGNGGGGGKPGGTVGPSQQQPSPTQGHHKFASYQQNVSATTQLMIQQQQQQQQRGNMNVRGGGVARYPAPIQRPVTSFPRHPHPHRAPHTARYKPPPPAAAATAHYYVPHGNTTKLNNAEMESKSEVTSSECESSKPSNNSKSSDVTTEDSKSAND